MHPVFKNSLQTPGTDSIMDPDKKEKDQRKQEESEDDESREYQEKWIKRIHQNLWDRHMCNELQFTDVNSMESINKLAKSIKCFPVKKVPGQGKVYMQKAFYQIHACFARLVDSRFIDTKGFDEIFEISVSDRVIINAIAETIKKHPEEYISGSKHAPVQVDSGSDVSDSSDDFERAGPANEPSWQSTFEVDTNDDASPVEEEEDYGEMEEVSDEEDDPNDPEYKP